VDNQQATPTEAELAWLGGIIEGEGSLAMAIYHHNGTARQPKVGLKVIVYNSDAGIMKQVVSILSRLLVGYHMRERELQPMRKANGEGYYKPTSPMLIITIGKFAAVETVLQAIRPWLFGDKAARADLMLQFLERRSAKNNGKRTLYDAGDMRLVLDFAHLGRRQDTTLVERVLNELEQGSAQH
jgi:hypothetical protein